MKTRFLSVATQWAPVALLVGVVACDGQIGSAMGGESGSGSGSSGGSGTGPGSGAGTGPGTGAGTTGTGSSTTGGSGTGSSTTGGSTGTGGGMPPPLNCNMPQAPALHAMLLSPTQYDNTVLDLVKVAGDPAKNFGDGVTAQLDDLSVERRANAAADVAHQAAVALSTWTPCMPATATTAACEGQIIDKIGPRAYRHPLSSSERTELQTLFDAGVKEKDFATGVEWFLSGVLQSPDFLYQVAKLQPGEMAGQVRALGAYELASRLAFFLWDSMPDDALSTAAASNDLGDPTKLGAQLTRMAQDQKFLRGVTSFYRSYLKLGSFKEVARDDAGFTTDVVNALQTSLLMSATQLYGGASPNVSGLFSGQTYYMNDVLRTFYGVGGTGTAFTAVAMNGEDRRGVLTHPGLMALLARPKESNPISRGLFIRRIVLCEEIPPPPAGVTIPQLPPVTPGLSTRDRLDQHASVALCAGCHSMIDPPGYALEGFDQVGRHRTVDSGRTVDTSANMVDSGDVTGMYPTGDGLMAKIEQSNDVKGCFAQKYFEFAVARASAAEDACSLDRLKKSFVPTGDLKQLVVTIANSDAFRYRLSEGGGP